MRYFFGNLPYSVTRADLQSALSGYSPKQIDLVLDPLTGRPRGYAFADCDEKPEPFQIGIRNVFIGDANGSD